MVAHICNLGIQEAEPGGMQRAPGQPVPRACDRVSNNKRNKTKHKLKSIFVDFSSWDSYLLDLDGAWLLTVFQLLR